jgi:hypothetical protein
LRTRLLKLLHQCCRGVVSDTHASLNQAVSNGSCKVCFTNAAGSEEQQIARLTCPIRTHGQRLDLFCFQFRDLAEIEAGQGLSERQL